MMILKIAWRNVWRSKGRSFVVMGSIVVGIWALVVGNGFMNGFMVGYMKEAIEYDISNVQVHHPQFKEDYDVNFFIPEGTQKAAQMRAWGNVRAATTRIIVNGMIASPKKAAGVQIRGIDKMNERKVTSLDKLVVEGDYFEGVKRNPIVIGSKLAETLKAKIRSKVVLTFNDKNGNITSAAFRIVGIVKSSSLEINERNAYVLQADIDKLLGMEANVHEIAVLTEENSSEQTVVDAYNAAFKGDLVEDWKLIAPEMALMQEMYGSMLYVLMLIILTALIFGIVNTMLMAVLERFKELGMLMAVGMNKLRIFMMIMMETLCLAVIASPFGLLVSYFTISYYRNTGVDLSSYSEGLEAFGYSSILYPFVSESTYVIVTIGVIVTAFLAAIYPAWKAVKLKPVEALHKI